MMAVSHLHLSVRRFCLALLSLGAGLPMLPAQEAAPPVPPAPAATDWTVSSRENLPARTTDGLESVQVKLTPSRSERLPVTAHVVIFRPNRFNLRVIDDPSGKYTNLRQAMESIDAVAGINGGYFHQDFTPLGLVVSAGKVLHPQEKASLLSGLLVSSARNLLLVRTEEFRLGKTTLEALQAGPFLVDGGTAVPGLNATKTARRTAIATLADGRWALVSLSPLTLAEAGAILAGDALWPGIEAERVLNLDGGSSTGFYLAAPAASGDKPLYLAEFGRVRNYVALVPRE